MAVYLSGAVTLLAGNPWKATASVEGSSIYDVTITRTNDALHAACSCPYYGSSGLCKHIWAVLLAADRKNYLCGNPQKLPQEIYTTVPVNDDLDPGLEELEEYLDHEEAVQNLVKLPHPRPPIRPAGAVTRAPNWRQMLASLREPPRNAPEAEWKPDRQIYYVVDTQRTPYDGSIALEVLCRDKNKNGLWGKLKPRAIHRNAIPMIPDQGDREILLTLCGAPDTYSYYPSHPCSFSLGSAFARIVFPKICDTGRCYLRRDPRSELEQMTHLEWDPGPAWDFHLGIESRNEQWVLRGKLRRGAETLDVAEASVLLEGLLIARGRMAALSSNGSAPWISLLRQTGEIAAPAEHGHDLVSELLSKTHLPPVEWPDDLRFEEVAQTPRFCLKLQRPEYSWQLREVLWAGLSFDYDGHAVAENHPASGVYDAAKRRLHRRDAAAEQRAAATLLQAGLRRKKDLFYNITHPGWECSQKKVPKIIRQLVSEGWRIESEGKLFRSAGKFRAELHSGIDWFELEGEVDFGSEQMDLPDLLRALERGEDMVQLRDGSFGMVPDHLVDRYGLLIRIGRKQGRGLRFSRSQAGLLDVLLAGREEVRVDKLFERARAELQQFNGIAPAEQPAGFVGRLRDYQLEGLAWMHFLRRFRFGGCLADDMGVGKTAQVLALLETRRQLRRRSAKVQPDERPGPSLAVVPRSLIYNWKREVERFTPRLRVLDYTGAARQNSRASLNQYDLILTTYGTLRRDAADFQTVRLDYVILDEAQAIKNPASESAKAVRLLQADHRLALSGTPVENHLGELWSLFEFLNPGMLGGAVVFQTAGDALRKPDDETRQLLAQAVRPFILRRTKDQVARELPAKIEQTLYCELDAEQRKLYNELRDHYRGSLLGQVERQGMARSRMHILEALLRLRQAACHPALIDSKRAADPSAKLEALLPQLSEVIEEGHKALVFSQFTSLLAIVRQQLDRDGIVYEYLDGKTRDREACVNRFQNDPACNLFLVSLKAGGVGLNLNAAEYVFLLDPWWNPAVEAQAVDRAHRIGQTKTVFAYRLIARDTVEEKVLELQKSKRDLADAIIRADTRLVSNLNRDDLQLLLS